MTHDNAFSLVAEHAPQQAGLLWDTSEHTGCDTATAVADQYSDEERDDAIAALRDLADGGTPLGWDRHVPPTVTFEVCSNVEWLRGCIDCDKIEDGCEDDAANRYAAELHRRLAAAGFETESAHGQRILFHGWNGANTFRHKLGPIGTFDVLTADEEAAAWKAVEESQAVAEADFAKVTAQ